MGSKNNPGEYDCYTKAEPDEPMFILLARDPAAPDLVRRWAAGHDPADPKIAEALSCADWMERWRAENRPASRKTP